LWDLEAGAATARWTVKRPTHRVVFSPDGRFLAVIGIGPLRNPVGLVVYSTAGHSVLELNVDDCYASFAEFESDSRHLLIADRHNFFRLRVQADKASKPLSRLVRAQRNMSKAALSPDGRYLAAVQFPDLLFTLDARTAAIIAEWPLSYNFEGCHALAFSPTCELIAVAAGASLLVGQTLTGELVASRRVGTLHFNDLVFTPDGRRLVTVSNDETVRLWDTGNWNEVGGFEWKIGRLATVAISPDGMRMAAGADSGKVVVWDYDD
jgi:WD40 repeat protein